MPVIYEITAIVETALCDAFEGYMMGRHIPDVLSSGAFSSAVFSRSAPARYRIRYEAVSRAALDNYLERDAAWLREDFLSNFPAGVNVEREEWEIVQIFHAPRVS
ncbi:MAG: DUF4286 family protein [Chloracidobacterium sp.]|nr:DUF4286 family protein [Chloracidobacterium sp.]